MSPSVEAKKRKREETGVASIATEKIVVEAKGYQKKEEKKVLMTSSGDASRSENDCRHRQFLQRGFESNLVKDRNHQLYLQKTLRNESLKNHSWTEEEFRGEREYLLVILPCTFNC